MGTEKINALDIGFSEAWEKVWQEAEKIRLPLKCSVCKYRHFCNVCAAVCYCETGGFDEPPQYVCELSENTAEFAREFSKKIRTDG